MRNTLTVSTHKSARIISGMVTVLVRPCKKQPPLNAKLAVVLPDGTAVFDIPKGIAPAYDVLKIKSPFSPGQVVGVREAWADALDFGYATGKYLYKATYTNGGPFDDVEKWQSPATMPPEAIRTHIRILSVTAKPVREITEEEAIAAGYEQTVHRELGTVEQSAWAWFKYDWEHHKKHPFETSWAWFMTIKKEER